MFEVLHCVKEIVECIKERIDKEFILFIIKAVLKRGNGTLEQERNSNLK